MLSRGVGRRGANKEVKADEFERCVKHAAICLLFSYPHTSYASG